MKGSKTKNSFFNSRKNSQFQTNRYLTSSALYREMEASKRTDVSRNYREMKSPQLDTNNFTLFPHQSTRYQTRNGRCTNPRHRHHHNHHRSRHRHCKHKKKSKYHKKCTHHTKCRHNERKNNKRRKNPKKTKSPDESVQKNLFILFTKRKIQNQSHRNQLGPNRLQ